ncbi:hypothetical protein HKBW3S44_01944, partial [Candidatus Hakubella thermalkaliphila]
RQLQGVAGQTVPSPLGVETSHGCQSEKGVLYLTNC